MLGCLHGFLGDLKEINREHGKGMSDIIHKLGFSVIQHGPYNKRIYLMKPDDRDMPGILPALDRLAEEKGYEKILVKIPAYARHAFEEGEPRSRPKGC